MSAPRPSRWALAPLAIALLLAASGAAADELDDLIDGVEAVVNLIGEDATAAFAARSEAAEACECSRHACGGEFDASDECHEELGDAPLCGTCTGQKLDFTKSFVLTPSSTDIGSMAADVKESICTYRGIDETFAAAKDQLGTRAWSYVATNNGVMRSWPGHAQERGSDVDAEEADERLGNCKKYDPRIRPWYTAASSGPKDVVLLVDTSASMLTEDAGLDGAPTTRWEVAKNAITSLLDTFSSSDYINLVEFSADAKALVPDQLLVATLENIDMLRDEVESVSPEGEPDFALGMELAFDLLVGASKTHAEGKELTSSGCQKIILFITDGEDCTVRGTPCARETPEGTTPVDAVVNFIEDKQQELVEAGSQRAHIFSFSFGRDADDEIPKEMACANEGVWGQILPGDDPLFKMHAYTSYLASQRGEAGVIWSRAYDDAFGLGPVITAARPIFSPPTSLGEPGSFVGVVGHDVRLDDVQEVAPEFMTVIRRWILRGIQCIDTDFTGCELQLLRDDEAQCPEILDDADCYYFEPADKYYVKNQDLLSFDDAMAACEGMGGALARIDDPEEGDIVSALASNAGSWIGLVFDEGTGEWQWQGGDAVPADSSMWIIRGIEGAADDGKTCASVDRRGVQHNVHPEECATPSFSICEFPPSDIPEQCKDEGKLVRVDGDHEYKVRPLSTCRTAEESRLDATAVSAAAESLTDEQTICPIGDPKTTFDFRCCDDCQG